MRGLEGWLVAALSAACAWRAADLLGCADRHNQRARRLLRRSAGWMRLRDRVVVAAFWRAVLRAREQGR